MRVYLANAVGNYRVGVKWIALKLFHRRFDQIGKETTITIIRDQVRIYFADRYVAGSCFRIVFRVEPVDRFTQYSFVISELLQKTDLAARGHDGDAVPGGHLVFYEVGQGSTRAGKALGCKVNIIDKKENYPPAIGF